MIGLIARKDFLLNITSARFILGFLICLFIIPFTLIVNVNRYNEQQQIYLLESESANTKLLAARTYSNIRPKIVRAPEPLSILSEGITKSIGSSVNIKFGEYPLFLTDYTNNRNNPFLNAFFSVDFITIIAIIMSLLALVFSYDCFTREHENGTLKMVLANPINRTSFLIGKLCGIMLTLLPILIFCYLLGILFITLSPDIQFTASNWASVALLFTSSLLYAIIFILIGMFISSMSRSSSTSVVLSLLVWIWFLFLVPTISFYLAKSFSETELYDNVDNALASLDKEFLNEEEVKFDIINKHLNNAISSRTFLGYKENFAFTTSSYLTPKFLTMMATWKEPRRANYADKKWAVQKKYLDKLVQQEKNRQILACLSPSEIFRQLSSSLCHTDAESYSIYMDKIRTFRVELIDYFKLNKFFETSLYFTPQNPNDFVLLEEIAKRGLREGEKIPELLYPNEYPPIDQNSFPKFNYKLSETSSITYKFALQRTAILLSIALVLLALTMLRFKNYKVQ